MTNYYDVHAQQFINDTIDVNMRSLYSKFLPLMPLHGLILDAGCGSGRDSKYFKSQGFKVHAFDASSELSTKASSIIGQQVELTTFQSFKSNKQFDAIWACASLLHVPKNELQVAFQNLANYLVDGGIFYVSFKYGKEERLHNGRDFTDMDEQSLNALIDNVSSLQIKETWQTGDARPGRQSEKWLNALLMKVK